MRTLAFLITAIVATTAQAGRGPTHAQAPLWPGHWQTQINDLGLDSSRSFKGEMAGYATIAFLVSYTHANNGALSFACTVSDDNSVTDYTFATCSTSSGLCTLQFPTSDINFQTASLSADKNFAFRWSVRGYDYYECTVSHGGSATSSDKITVKTKLVTE